MGVTKITSALGAVDIFEEINLVRDVEILAFSFHMLR